MIELKNITKTFYKNGVGINALSDVSLFVPKGKIFGVIGASGAGKSTLIRCVNLLEKPSSGEVIVAGQQMTRLPAKDLMKARRQIGMIFQHFNLLHSHAVFENIAFPLKLSRTPAREIKTRVTDLLSLVGLEEKMNSYPAALSGGQKQRVAIARALASNPKVLLCDEATSALDPATTKSILALLKDITQRLGITVLLITHEMDVVKTVCDEVAMLSEGRLVEAGPVGNIFSEPKTETAKAFIQSSLHVDVPTEYQQRLQSEAPDGLHPLVRLQVAGSYLDSPVLSEAARLFGVDNHIVCARIDTAGGTTFGAMLLEVRGKAEAAQKAINYFNGKGIHTTIVGYV